MRLGKPHTVSAKDLHGRTALDYALEQGLGKHGLLQLRVLSSTFYQGNPDGHVSFLRQLGDSTPQESINSEDLLLILSSSCLASGLF